MLLRLLVDSKGVLVITVVVINRLLNDAIVIYLLMLVVVHYSLSIFLFYFRLNHNIDDQNPKWHEIAARECGPRYCLP